MIRGLIFDFDGLILDTETPDYQAWQEVYAQFGCEFPLELWAHYMGLGWHVFDIYAHLAEQFGRPIDREAVRAERRARFHALLDAQPPLPGVTEYLQAARRLGLRVGVASSSSRAWVSGHLERLRLTEYFATFACADDVMQVKPDPALYQLALTQLGLRADEAIALEDSPNGALAAARAGLYCVLVPVALVRTLPQPTTDLRLDSLADLPLEQLIARAEN